MRKESTLLCAVLLTALTPTPAVAAIRYNVTDLGTLPGYDSSRAWSINNKGQIVGEAFNIDPLYNNRAVLFDPNGDGNNIDLGTLGGENSWADSINNKGQIVGGADSNDSQYSPQPTIFDPNGEGKNTGLGEKGHAHSINDHSQIVGCVGSLENFRAVLFDTTGHGNNVDLGTLDGTIYSVAYSMNNSGQIVGYTYNDFFAADFLAILFDRAGQGNNIDLGTLGGESSVAISINDYGHIVGRADTASDSAHATLFDPNGQGNNRDLGTVAGCNYAWATSINNKGQIVGQATNYFSFSPMLAILFDPTGSGNNIDLNILINPELGWSLHDARCINDSGQIVGAGTNPDGNQRAILLTPATPGDSEPDRDVDLRDFAVFAAAWRSTPHDHNWDPFCDISEPKDGLIDERDLAVFSSNWLAQQ